MRAVICVLVAFVTLSSGPAASASTRSGVVYCLRVADLGIPWTTTLRGDVDGDRVVDTVSTRAIWLASGGCRAWLVVETARARFRAPIEPIPGALLKPPGLAGLIRLRPGHRLDIAVVVWLGASTGFLDVYGLRGHRLVRLSDTAHEYAGSVVNRAGVDCAEKRGARLVASFATWDDTERRYHVKRTFYELRGGALSMVPRLTERDSVTFGGLARYPELAVLVPFPSCAAVVGTS